MYRHSEYCPSRITYPSLNPSPARGMASLAQSLTNQNPFLMSGRKTGSSKDIGVLCKEEGMGGPFIGAIIISISSYKLVSYLQVLIVLI